MWKPQIFSLDPMILVGFLVLVESLVQSGAVWVTQDLKTYEYNRTSFPSRFIFGAASAAYQNEGAVNEGGRGTSIWDTFAHEFPDKITDHSSGVVAVDSYHRYKEDVQILKNMEMNGYRFSISWPRLLPKGKLSGGVNKEGIQYYNNLINELLSKGVKPFVTIFHWDLPQPLQDEYGGFLSPRIVDDFKDFAELCFKEFGDRVKHWITINEPWTFIYGGYARGIIPPGRCSKFLNCPQGDSATEPYIVGHHMLLAHAAAAKVYKGKYQARQKGKIGITLNTDWMVPHSETQSDHEAAIRSLDFSFGWFMRPLTNGHYPINMRYLVKDRLPKFTRDQLLMVRGSIDFLGLNYYCSSYATDVPQKISANPTYLSDSYVNVTYDRNGTLIGPQSGSFWLHVYPKGIKDLLLYIKKRYNNPVIYITENGYSEANDKKITLQEALKDDVRVDYYKSHLFNLQQAIKEGVQVRGYFAWTLVDNYEWSSGYSVKFGLNYVDRNDGLKRYPKASAVWFKNFLQHKI